MVVTYLNLSLPIARKLKGRGPGITISNTKNLKLSSLGEKLSCLGGKFPLHPPPLDETLIKRKLQCYRYSCLRNSRETQKGNPYELAPPAYACMAYILEVAELISQQLSKLS